MRDILARMRHSLSDPFGPDGRSGMRFEGGAPLPGDVLSVHILGFRHYGIYAGQNSVIDSSRRDGCVRYVTLARFAGERRHIRNHGLTGPLSRGEVITRAVGAVGQPWRLHDRNCQHFARYCAGLEGR